ncbi:hypothetical protein KSX_92810 [Ktedonospora formicarum]|uniref:Propionate 3-nitronate monooxygenase n=2 Tax=Ktedonospora formicarum TaxID=2778364 RepID=A0A8J3MYS4_9CHLR|nr:hypothetical protein KSX_92810 [Ktedonospora formicarum]
MFRTRLTEEYTLQIPFIGAGMAFVTTPALVAAVSNAGGMGTLGASLIPHDQLRELLRQIRSMTTGPFGVNFIPHLTEKVQLEVCIEEHVSVVSFF